MFETVPRVDTKIDEQTFKLSYIAMECAPYGDFHDLTFQKHLFNQDEVLLRTFFKHLVDGLDYLHSNDISHLDLKLENLLLGEDFKLKIIDFGFSNCKAQGDNGSLGSGTEDYRAPEVINGQVEDYKAADIFSLGIILFVMTFGFFPYQEDEDHDDFSLYTLLIR
mmetsp:Transcript_22495/g.19455  ORF Transcript_22495/g.19455 Transcript_22495/m.19455 type:complete len:165 (+) Transcript_22495:382-876(+)